MFNEIAKYIMDLGATSSRNDKMAKLAKYSEVPGFKEILQFIFDPYTRTGIAAAKLKKNLGTSPAAPLSWEEIIGYFLTNNTGKDANVIVAQTFIEAQTTEEAKQLAEAICTKTLKVGVTATSLNKAYGAAFIPLIGIMKAVSMKDISDKNFEDYNTKFIVTEKLDGARRLVIKENGKVTIYTRSGIVDEGLTDIEREAEHIPDNFVLDGELLAIGEFNDAIALRQASNGIANSSGPRGGVKFHIFDGMPLDEYKRGVSTNTALQRKVFIAALFDDHTGSVLTPKFLPILETFKLPYQFEYFVTVPILGWATTKEDAIEYARAIWDRGFEGVMLNTPNGKYDHSVDRSKSIIKVKSVSEYKLQIKGFEEGEGRLAGTLGALIVDYKGNSVGVGSGLDDAMRKRLWDNQDKYLHTWVELDSFGESKNKQGGVSLNCPIFKRLVGEEDHNG
ncbi:ATP-dependent DNA ligase [compost metagenome]